MMQETYRPQMKELKVSFVVPPCVAEWSKL